MFSVLHDSLNLFTLINHDISDKYLPKSFQQGYFKESYISYNSIVFNCYYKRKTINYFFNKNFSWKTDEN